MRLPAPKAGRLPLTYIQLGQGGHPCLLSPMLPIGEQSGDPGHDAGARGDPAAPGEPGDFRPKGNHRGLP